MDASPRPSPAWSTVRRLLRRGASTRRLVLGAIPEAVLAVDGSEQVAYVNATAATVFGDTPEKLTGRSLHHALETIGAEGARGCAICAGLAQPGEHHGTGTAIAGAARTAVRWTGAPIFERGERVGVVFTLEREPTPSELESRHQERVTREMQAMLADLAHELNNPLTVILAAAGMMRESNDADLTRRRVDLIAEAAERCVGIVRTFRTALIPPRADELHVIGATPPAAAPAPPPRAQILVVDDDPLVASAMATALNAEGHEVDVAGDGLAALARVSTRRYDVILTDVRMPRLDGPGFFHELGRVRPELVSRVVFVTGDTLSATTRRFLEQCGAPSMKKPFEPRQVRAAVRRVLAGDAQRDIA
jgi:CheY-like chemotaxis protein